MTSPDQQHGSMLKVGVNVCIVNLVGAPQFNNKKGIIRSFQSDTGRYNVELKLNNKSKKSLGVKPEKLVLLCKCLKQQARLDDTSHCCARCDFPYCSTKCREADWNDKHKAECIPKDLPDPPEPVTEDDDTGDEVFEASTRYLIMATEAGNDGRHAEQVALLEAYVEKDGQQAAALHQLFQRHSDPKGNHTDHEKAFEYLQRSVRLLVDPRLARGSDPQSVTDIPTEPHSIAYFYAQVIRQGMFFIDEHRVTGRSGEDLKPEAYALGFLILLSDKIAEEDTTTFSRYDRSQLHSSIANVYRKMKRNEQAIEHLRLSDSVLAPEQDHNIGSLLLIPEIINYQGYISNDPAEKREKIQAAVDEARKLQEFMSSDPSRVYNKADVLLAKMLYNQYQMKLVPPEHKKKHLAELYQHAQAGYQGATADGNTRDAAFAKNILEHFEKTYKK
jgi:hypothetical protein